MLLVINILVFLLNIVNVTSDNGFELELVQVIFRHGDRTPDRNELYPNDRYDSSIYEPYGYGQLTNKGKLRAYRIGEFLRTKYGNFISDVYKSEEVYGFSDYMDRTKMTLELVLAGLYPPVPQTIWNTNVYWNPVPFDYQPEKYNFMQTLLDCPIFLEKFFKNLKAIRFYENYAKNKDVMNYLEFHTGRTMNSTSLVAMHSLITSQESLGFPHPIWCTDDVYKNLENLVAQIFDQLSGTNELMKISTGPIIKKFIKNVNNNELKRDGKKMYLYSGRDLIVHSFTRAHGFNIPRIVEYGTAVIFEKLKGRDNEIYVRLFLRFGVSEKLIVLKLPNCSEICPWKTYMKIVEPILPIDEGTECLYEAAHRNVENLINGLPLINASNKLTDNTLFPILYSVMVVTVIRSVLELK